MKIARTLTFALVASMLAARAELPEDVDTEGFFYSIPLATDLRLDRIEMKDLEASYLVHNAENIRHGPASITLRFRNRAAQERSFLVSVGIEYSACANRNFSIQPGGTVEFTLFMPRDLGAINQAKQFSIIETTSNASAGRQMKNLDVSMGEFDLCSEPREYPQLLLSAGISPKKLQDDLSKAMHARRYTQKYKRSNYSSSSSGTTREYRAEPFGFDARQFKFPAANWPGDWRCYSTYDGVFITADEYAALGATAKSALETYRTLGGTVVVAKGPDGFADQKEAADVPQMIDQSCDVLSRDLHSVNDGRYFKNKGDITEDLKRVPIAAKATIPVNTLLVVLAVFALGIVPLAVFISVRRNVRMKLLVLLPGAAAVFAVIIAIAAYIFFGTTPSVRLQSVTVLDQTTKKALTLGQFAIFSPVSVDGRIEFPSDAAFVRRYADIRDKDDVRVESATAQRLAGDWVKPLVTTFFDFMRVCERPERLDFRVSPNGDVSVVNLLGAKVKWGQVNVGGRLWTFRDVEPGVTAQAEKHDKLPHPQGNKYPFYDEQTSFGRDWEKCVEWAASSFQKTPPGEYVVEVEGSPFFENPLQRKKANTSAAGLVYGKFKEVAE